MNLNVKLFSVIFMFLMFSSCSSSNLDKKTIKIQKQDGTFVSVIAEIADTEESRTYGFMNRKKFLMEQGCCLFLIMIKFCLFG